MTRQRHRPGATAAIAMLAVALAGLPLLAANAQAPLFDDHDTLDLTLTASLRTLVAQRRQRPELAGILSYTAADGTSVELDVEVRPRGNSRLEVCSFPPLSLNFRRRQVEGTVFAGQNRLKLVTLCRTGASFEQYLELEYLTYRIYAQLSDTAFRVRRVRVRYIDTDRNDRETLAPAFLIEHINEVAARVGMDTVERDRIDHTEIEPRSLATLGLFQFAIGNTDWSATAGPEGEACCHNGDTLAARQETDQAIVVVPYDFDQSGFIGTSYAVPNKNLGIRSVRQRLYRGFCVSNDFLSDTIARFNVARPAIDALLGSGMLTERVRENATDYLMSAFDIINDPQSLQREILGRCRG
jgi:hypothetical protein